MSRKKYLVGLILIERKKIFQGLEVKRGRKYLSGLRLTEGKKMFKELEIN